MSRRLKPARQFCLELSFYIDSANIMCYYFINRNTKEIGDVESSKVWYIASKRAFGEV